MEEEIKTQRLIGIKDLSEFLFTLPWYLFFPIYVIYNYLIYQNLRETKQKVEKEPRIVGGFVPVHFIV